MMLEHTYQKKPVQVQAFQMTPERRESNQDWPDWLHDAWNKEPEEPGRFGPVYTPGPKTNWAITTLEGVMTVRDGDWIIRGVEGELYPCKDEIFKKTYQKVTPQMYMDQRNQIDEALGDD